jgi:hypothetical protein
VSKLSTLLRKINQNNLSLSNFSVVCGAGRTLLPLFPFFSRPKAGRFCRGELWSVSLSNCVRPPAIIGPPTIIIVPPAGRFCRGELRSPTGNNQPTDNNNRPTGNNRPARFLGFWGNLGYLGARDAPLRVLGGLGARDAPLRVLGEFGDLGARNAPLRVLDAAEGEKPPHQVNLDTFREKIFLHRESLK